MPSLLDDGIVVLLRLALGLIYFYFKCSSALIDSNFYVRFKETSYENPFTFL